MSEVVVDRSAQRDQPLMGMRWIHTILQIS